MGLSVCNTLLLVVTWRTNESRVSKVTKSLQSQARQSCIHLISSILLNDQVHSALSAGPWGSGLETWATRRSIVSHCILENCHRHASPLVADRAQDG